MRRTTLLIVAVLALALMLAAPAQAEPKTAITFAEVGWVSIRFHNAVAGTIA